MSSTLRVWTRLSAPAVVSALAVSCGPMPQAPRVHVDASEARPPSSACSAGCESSACENACENNVDQCMSGETSNGRPASESCASAAMHLADAKHPGALFYYKHSCDRYHDGASCIGYPRSAQKLCPDVGCLYKALAFATDACNRGMEVAGGRDVRHTFCIAAADLALDARIGDRQTAHAALERACKTYGNVNGCERQRELFHDVSSQDLSSAAQVDERRVEANRAAYAEHNQRVDMQQNATLQWQREVREGRQQAIAAGVAGATGMPMGSGGSRPASGAQGAAPAAAAPPPRPAPAASQVCTDRAACVAVAKGTGQPSGCRGPGMTASFTNRCSDDVVIKVCPTAGGVVTTPNRCQRFTLKAGAAMAGSESGLYWCSENGAVDGFHWKAGAPSDGAGCFD